MPSTAPNFKDQFTIKFLEIQLLGLEQYAKYLKQQLKLSNQHEHWQVYKKYIEKEIIRNDKKILKVKEQMTS